MRRRYSSIGVEFAITNSGGLRADLTCPTTDLPGDFCPPFTPPPYPITRGQNLAVLPFGNVVVTSRILGRYGVRAGLVDAPAAYPCWGSVVYSRQEILDFIAETQPANGARGLQTPRDPRV